MADVKPKHIPQPTSLSSTCFTNPLDLFHIYLGESLENVSKMWEPYINLRESWQTLCLSHLKQTHRLSRWVKARLHCLVAGYTAAQCFTCSANPRSSFIDKMLSTPDKTAPTAANCSCQFLQVYWCFLFFGGRLKKQIRLELLKMDLWEYTWEYLHSWNFSNPAAPPRLSYPQFTSAPLFFSWISYISISISLYCLQTLCVHCLSLNLHYFEIFPRPHGSPFIYCEAQN